MRSPIHVYMIYGMIVMYASCYQMQAPLEPFLVGQLIGDDKGSDAATEYGKLQSFFNVVQTLGSLTFGYLLDRTGVRVGFAINFLCCAATYAILSQTTTIGMLYLSKVPSVGMAGFLVAQVGMSKLTEEGVERVSALGRLTTAYTIGGVMGPYIGGVLGSSGDYYLSAKLATVGCLLAAFAAFLLPAAVDETVGDKPSDKEDTKPKVQTPFIDRAKLLITVAGGALLVKFITNVANSMAQSTQVLIMKNDLQFGEADLGTFLSASFAFGGVANGFLLGPLTSVLGGKVGKVVQNSACIMMLCYGLRGALFHPAYTLLPEDLLIRRGVFIGLALFLSLFQFAMGTSITVATTKLVPQDMVGTLIGSEHGIFAVARVFSPFVGTSLLTSGGIPAVSAACAACFAAAVGVWQIGVGDRGSKEEDKKA